MKEIESWKIKLLLWPVILTGVFLVFIVKIILPKVGETNKQLKLVEEVKQKTKSVIERINYINSVDQEALVKNESNVSAALMPDKNPYWLVVLVSKLGEDLGYSLTSFTVSPGIVGEEAEGGKNEVKASMELSGPKEKYIDLLWAIENSLPIITVTDFKMKAGGEVAGVELTLLAYYLPERQGTDLNKLNLKDLVLDQKETGLLGKLTELKRIEGVEVGSPSGERIRYDRVNPFTL